MQKPWSVVVLLVVALGAAVGAVGYSWLKPSGQAQQAKITDWLSLVPEDAYAFIPEQIPDSLWDDPEFNRQLEEADKTVKPAVQGEPTRLPGYMVPLDYEGENVTRFLLVPQAGQCVHVPPPPVNQTIMVKLDRPVPMRSLYEPIEVSGRLGIHMEEVEIAQTGYIIENAQVADYQVPEDSGAPYSEQSLSEAGQNDANMMVLPPVPEDEFDAALYSQPLPSDALGTVTPLAPDTSLDALDALENRFADPHDTTSSSPN